MEPEIAQSSKPASARLTDEQRAVIHARQCHQRVIAVAGSGKTSTLLAQVRALLADGVPPRRILVLMYNRSAQQDFQRRLQTARAGALPDIRTFHSLGLSIYHTLIRREHLPAFDGNLLGTAELESRVWRWLQELADSGDQAQDIQNNKRKWVEPAMTFVERVKAGLAPPEQVFDELGLNFQARPFVRLFERLEEWRHQQHRITFADMLYDPVRYFSDNPDIAAGFSNHLDHIIVDEFQDINACQHQLLEIVAGNRATVTIVGDPDQTIYQFRGSNPSFMLHHFPASYPDAESRALTCSFRYGPRLSELANNLIQHNRDREPILTRSHEQTPDTRVEFHTVEDDVTATIRQLRTWHQESDWHSMAILHRLWAQAARLELQLMTERIPFRLEHTGSVLQRNELQPLLSLLAVASGRFHNLRQKDKQTVWMQWLTQPYPKVQRKLLTGMAAYLSRQGGSPGKALLGALPDQCSNWQREQLGLRAEVLQLADRTDVPAPRLITAWLNNTDYLSSFADSAFSAQQGDEQQQTVQGFLAFLRQHERTAADTDAWLQQLLAERQSQQQADGGILLTSIHKAKGREWDRVLIPGLNRHLYPYRPEGDLRLPVDEESERRLLYVAVTRARQHLVLLVPSDPTQRSVFAQEMGHQDDADIAPGPSESTRPGSNMPSPNHDRVRHPHFGPGEVIREDQAHYHIRFSDGRTRVFVREIADGLLSRLP